MSEMSGGLNRVPLPLWAAFFRRCQIGATRVWWMF